MLWACRTKSNLLHRYSRKCLKQLILLILMKCSNSAEVMQFISLAKGRLKVPSRWIWTGALRWNMSAVLTPQSRNAFMNTSDLLDEDIWGTYGTSRPSGTEGGELTLWTPAACHVLLTVDFVYCSMCPWISFVSYFTKNVKRWNRNKQHFPTAPTGVTNILHFYILFFFK